MDREQVQGEVDLTITAQSREETHSDYGRTGVGLIPEEWASQPLRDDISLYSGHHVLASNCNTSGIGIPYVTGPADFPDGHIKQTKFTAKPTTLCKAGDILVTVKGSGSGTIVKADAEYCISRQLMAIRTQKWEPTFLLYSLHQNSPRIKAASTGLIPGLSRSDILEQEIPVPKDPAEQRAIAEALSDVDDLLSTLDELITKKRDIKEAAMQQLLTGKTCLPGFSGEWEPKRLRDTCTFLPTANNPRADLSDKGDVEYIHYGDIHAYARPVMDCTSSNLPRTSRSRVGNAAELVDGDLVMVDASEDLPGVGKSIEVQGVSGRTIVAGLHTILCRGNQDAWATGFKAYLQFLPTFRSALARLTSGTSVYAISKKQLADVEVQLPALAEQEAIVSVLSDMDAEIAKLEQRRYKIDAIKQGMMQELLTGRVRLVKPDVVAEASSC